MKINFNNLRKKIAGDYNALVRQLNAEIIDGTVEMSVSYLKPYMDNLCGGIGGLLSCYDGKGIVEIDDIDLVEFSPEE